MLIADAPPLRPDADTARDWLSSELSGVGYRTDLDLRERILRWLARLFDTRDVSGVAPSWLLTLIVLALVAVAAFVIIRSVIRPDAPGARPRSTTVLGDEALTAAEYRSRAEVAFREERYDAALVDAFRGVAAASVERTLLTDLPGRTAHEVALELGPIFPAHADTLTQVAADFDAIRYGDLHRDRAGAQRALDLDTALHAMRPVL